MIQIKIGYTYKLNIAADVYENPILWLNQRSKKFFSILEEIDGKLVIVKTKTNVYADRYIVALVELPKDMLYMQKNYLELEIGSEDIPCSCDITILVARGCQCGAFKKEMESK